MAKVNTKKLLVGGFRICWTAFPDADGYIMGTATPAKGATGAAAYELDGVKTANVSVKVPDIINFTGKDIALGAMIFPPAEVPGFDMETAMRDMTFDGLAQGVDPVDYGNITITAAQPTDPEYPDMMLMFQRRAKSQDSGSKGGKLYEGWIAPKATIIPLDSDGYKERQASQFKYQVIANVADVLPWGELVADTALGTESAPIFPLSSNYLLRPISFIGDGTVTDFTIPWTPPTSDVDEAIIAKAGVPLTSGVTINTSTKKLIFADAPADNAKIVAFLPYLA
jgi:hypothetical protein